MPGVPRATFSFFVVDFPDRFAVGPVQRPNSRRYFVAAFFSVIIRNWRLTPKYIRVQ